MNRLFVIFVILIGLMPLNAFAQVSGSTQTAQDTASKANDPGQMLPSDIEARFKGLASDPAPKNLVRNSHYWISNEHAHYVWYPHIKDKGGVISGVGTDQVYLLAGWANASLVIPMDFDREITRLHFAYGAAFMASSNIEEFLSFWKKKNADKMKAALDQYFPDLADDAMKAWERANADVNHRLNRVAKKYSNSKKTNDTEVPTFVSDEGQFKRIKQLWENHRGYPVCGDLTGNVAMQGISKALRDSGLKMMILYPSNAEQYFQYGPEFKRNIIDMPFAQDSMILRTRQLTSLGVAEDGDYHYNIQSGENFQAYMKDSTVPDQLKMLKFREKTLTKGLSVLSALPEAKNAKKDIN